MYKFKRDKNIVLNVEIILKLFPQENIYKLVFKEAPSLDKLYLSPFRKDRNPQCYFEWYNNKLRFKDWGNSTTIKGVHMKNIDCFDCVRIFYNLKNLPETLEFIYESLENFIPFFATYHKPTTQVAENKKVLLIPFKKEWDYKTEKYWANYKLKKTFLSNVVSIKQVICLNTKKGDFIINCNQKLAFCYYYPSGNKKIYFPEETGKKRFLSTCTENDIGINIISPGDKIIITKSLKDAKVLELHGINVIHFQNEGMLPNGGDLKEILKNYEHIIIWFDNDLPGINASLKVKNFIKEILPDKKVSEIKLPLMNKIKDPSDCVRYNYNYFLKFIEILK